MAGILRNETGSPNTQRSEFNRAQVLANTEQNAKLGSEGEQVRRQLKLEKIHDTDSTRKRFPKTKAPAALRPNELKDDEGFTKSNGVEFDEDEINEWDQQRGQTEKILEPNTPYMGTAKDTEYYDEDPVPDDLNLGDHA